MRKLIFISLILFSLIIHSQERNINCVILINEELVYESIAEIKLINGPSENYISYYPGDLIISDSLFLSIKSKENNRQEIHFDHYTFGRKTNILNIEVTFGSFLMDHPYIVLHIYDFRKKKYKRMYQCYTDNEYFYEWEYPNSGIRIPCSD